MTTNTTNDITDLLTRGPLRSIYTNGVYLTAAMAAQLDTVPTNELHPIARVRIQGTPHIIGIHARTQDLAITEPHPAAMDLPLAVLY